MRVQTSIRVDVEGDNGGKYPVYDPRARPDRCERSQCVHTFAILEVLLIAVLFGTAPRCKILNYSLVASPASPQLPTASLHRHYHHSSPHHALTSSATPTVMSIWGKSFRVSIGVAGSLACGSWKKAVSE